MKHSMKGLLALLLMITAGCSSKSAVAPTDTADTSVSPEATPSAVVSTPSGYGFDEFQTGPLGDVFYEFDSSELSADAAGQLKQNAAWMGANATAATLVQGHCDERGTSEYNIALGERRADSAKEYMVRLGASAASIETVSYGEERPFAQGHDEAAWSKNRRAHFVLK